MKVMCRKCKIEWDDEQMTFGDIEDLQMMKCSVFGNHRIIGVMG